MPKQIHDFVTREVAVPLPSPRPRALLLLVTAVLQVLSVPLAGFDQGVSDDPVVVPPGGFFAVWSLVLLGCLLSAVYGLAPRRSGALPWRRVQLPLAGVQVLFALWLLAASSAEVLTLPVFLGMLALLVPVLLVVLRTATGATTRLLLGGTVGVYAGWTSAAVWVNAVTLLPQDALDGDVGLAVQVVAVLGAAATVCAVTVAAQAWPPYVLAGAWALVGIAVSAVSADEPALWSSAAAGLLAVGVASVVGVRRRLRRAPGPGSAATGAPGASVASSVPS